MEHQHVIFIEFTFVECHLTTAANRLRLAEMRNG
jgi:hypothetical protein